MKHHPLNLEEEKLYWRERIKTVRVQIIKPKDLFINAVNLHRANGAIESSNDSLWPYKLPLSHAVISSFELIKRRIKAAFKFM